jgi:hypothetical protein
MEGRENGKAATLDDDFFRWGGSSVRNGADIPWVFQDLRGFRARSRTARRRVRGRRSPKRGLSTPRPRIHALVRGIRASFHGIRTRASRDARADPRHGRTLSRDAWPRASIATRHPRLAGAPPLDRRGYSSLWSPVSLVIRDAIHRIGLAHARHWCPHVTSWAYASVQGPGPSAQRVGASATWPR